jgi:glycosyltransferase involved in cell wall biosynthesis
LPAETLKNRIEGYGLALLDAAAMGVPVVATDCGGISEAVQHCRTGLIVPPGDKQAFVDAVLQITQDETSWSQFSLAAREYAQRKSWNEVAEKLFAS